MKYLKKKWISVPWDSRKTTSKGDKIKKGSPSKIQFNLC